MANQPKTSVPSRMKRGMNSACMNSLFILAHHPDILGDDCPALLHVYRFWVEIPLHFNPVLGAVV